jgi:hypothetical protein
MKNYILEYNILLIPDRNLSTLPMLYSIKLKVWEKVTAGSHKEARKYAQKRAGQPRKIINDCNIDESLVIFSTDFHVQKATEEVSQREVIAERDQFDQGRE